MNRNIDLAAGLKAARFFRSMAVGRGDPMAAEAFLEHSRLTFGWNDALAIKAAVNPMTTENGPASAAVIGRDFAALVRPQTIVGRLPALRQVPLRTSLVRQISGVTSYWVPEGAPIPLSGSTFAREEPLEPMKIAALAVVTAELAVHSEADSIVRSDLGGAAVTELDLAFTDPGNAGVANERPASITYGAPAIAASGITAAAARADLRALIAGFAGDLSTSMLLMHPTVAVGLALTAGDSGSVSIDVAAGAGRIFGLPVLLSSAVPFDTGGSPIILADQAGIEFAGMTEAELRTSKYATLQMTSTPTSGAANAVSMFQTNAVAMLAEIPVAWRVAREGSVAYIVGANYGG